MIHLPIFTDPSESELNSRKSKLLISMDERGLDCLVITDPDNVYWLTNFANYIHERPFILLLSISGQLTFIIPELERQHAKTRSIGNIELASYYEFPCEKEQAWLGVFQKRMSPYKNVGIELNAPQFISKAIQATSEASELIEVARYVKSDYELGRIVYSCNVATKALERLLKMAKPGLSLLEVHSKITKLMQMQLLSDNPQINPLATDVAAVVQPPNVSHDPHNFTNVMDMDMCLGGPHVSIINGKMNGYGSEVERTFFLGKVPSKALDDILLDIEQVSSIDRAGVMALAKLHNESITKSKRLSIIGFGCKELYQHFKSEEPKQTMVDSCEIVAA